MANAPISKDPTSFDAIDAELETILTSFDTSYVWNYGNVKEGLHDLYEKSKREQWNGSELLDWSTNVDADTEILPAAINPLADYGPFKKLSEKEATFFGRASLSWQLSQFMHGEQGALITASQLVGAVPWMDAKYYASTQTIDEARHVEVFSRYLHEKLDGEWPINPNLKSLLDMILKDSRWDFKYLGMQILVEGLAMAAFANLYNMATEPLLKDLIYNVMRDESRHVAFGVLSLKGYYDDMEANELRDREDFVIEASLLMRDRLIGTEVADVVGFDRKEYYDIMKASPIMVAFRQSLFARVVPNIKKLGLMTPRVRAAFEDMQIIHFEDVDSEAEDRALGL
ncbi:MAG: ferritin-like domain-containing protein [Myxococcales bacterium]|nr:ferritin-like domain-containing protein [Myxococcales bacterium]